MAEINSDRVRKTKINSIVALLTHICQILLGFVIRKIFIKYLGVTYLGYNSVFANILQMLNLADMGIGVAITSFLYKPLAENDTQRVAAILDIYKRLYHVIGFVVLVVGMIVSLFLNILIPDADCGIWYLRLLFYINLIGTVSTYFLAYKRTLLIADQKSYLTNIVDTVISLGISVSQIILLILVPNYIIYLSLNIAKNIISNVIVSIRVNKDYTYIKEEINSNLVCEYKPQIVQYIKDVFVSRIGAVVYYSTDNVILSVIKGSLLTGFLSNYTMITGQLNTVVTQVLSSVQATFGNYISTTDDKCAKMKMTDNYFCVNFCIGNFCMICFSLLVQPFVKMFFRENMLMAFSTALWLGINLMLTFLIQLPSQVFIIYKLFRYDRPIIIVSAILNIIISVTLVNIVGINGVLIGTFVTSLIYLFSRFYIISKYVYEVEYCYYIKKIGIYGIISGISFFITYIATKNLEVEGIEWFCVKVFFVGLISVLITMFFLSFTKEFEFLKNKLLPIHVRKYFNRILIGFGCILLITCSVIVGGGTNHVDFSTAGNKSYDRNDSYIQEANTSHNIFSLSFDDTILIFKDIAKNKPESIFDNSILRWYKSLHDKYGVVISCYVIYEDDSFKLDQFPVLYKEEFISNSDWLRFGFHTINGDIDYKERDIEDDYLRTINVLERIVGTKSIDNVIRLQMFQGSYKNISKLSKLYKEPIYGVLTSDDNRQSYYLDDINNSYIYNHDRYFDSDLQIYFYSTDFRTEYVENIDYKLKELQKDCWNNQTGDLVVFSHEWALNMENQQKIEKVCKYAMDSGYKFEFFEDSIY